MLGLTIKNEQQQGNEDFTTTLKKMQTVTEQRCNRQLSLIGKTMLVNSLLSSLFIYKMQVLPPMSKSQVEKFYKAVNKLIWNDKKPKIPRAV